MLATIITSIYLSIPLVFSGIAHMAVVKLDLWPNLKRPIDRETFGPNKTWRGFVAMPLLTVPGVWIGRLLDGPLEPHLLVSLHDAPAIVLGLALGLGYAAAELPNSWWKRRRGVAPGQLPERQRLLYMTVDQADSAVGCALVYALFLQPPLSVLVAVIFIGPVVHLLVNVSLYLAGLRERPV
jgi:hypothetical protein